MDKWQDYEQAQKKTKLLLKSDSEKDHAKILEILIEAGNQVGVISGVFSSMYDASDSFKKYIVPKVVEHQFYRYKCVVDGIAGGFRLYYPIKDSKKFVCMLNDILSGDYQKYLDTKDTHIIYTLFCTLYMVDLDVYHRYYNDALISEDKYKRFMAFHFACRRRIDNLTICNTHFMQEDMQMYVPLLNCIPSYGAYLIKGQKEKSYKIEGNGETERELFYKLCALQERLPKKNIVYKTSEQIWFQHVIGRNDICKKVFYLLFILKDKNLVRYYEEKHYDKMDATEKVMFINLFKDSLLLDYRREMLNYFSYKELYRNDEKNEKYFSSNPLTADEAIIVSEFLKTKKTDVKKHIVEHYQKMCDKEQVKLKKYLENAAEEYKREAAKDLTVIIEQQVEPEKCNQEITVKFPEIKFPAIEVKELPESKVVDCFLKMKQFVEKYKDYQYKSSVGEDRIFGSQYYPLNYSGDYPLQNESDAVIQELDLTPDELAYFKYACLLMKVRYMCCFDTTTIGRKLDKIAHIEENRNLATEYFVLMLDHYIQANNSADVQRAVTLRMLSVWGRIKISQKERNARIWFYAAEEDRKPQPMWKRLIDVAESLNHGIHFELLDKETLTLYFKAIRYAQEDDQCPKVYQNSPWVLSYLHKTGVASESEIFELLIREAININAILSDSFVYGQDRLQELYLYSGTHSKEYIDLVERAVMYMLNIEIQRSQAETVYSHRIARCPKLFGITYYLKALQAFQKMTLPRASYGRGRTKDSVFANIVQSTVPYQADTYENFVKLIKELKLSDKDLVKGALFNNNNVILDWTDRYLNKKGFVSTVLFFKAHLRDTGVAKSVKDKIALYSPIDILDFQEGAVDIDWFWQIKNETDDKTFQLVYDNAKYITVANLHKRAQRFNDALTGTLSKEECLDKIKEKRNKEYILYYSLIPLESDRDTDERYALIMQFLQESKQFGAQRQTSEKKACEVALENLARARGYDDVDRFVWFMESKSASLIAPYFVPKQIGDAEVFLKISDRFKVSIAAVKNGKEAASIPASIKNDAYVTELKAAVPVLNKQSARVIKSLEAAMEREGKFTAAELGTIAKNPLIKQILSALFFVAGNKICTYAELEEGKETECILAHPLDLLNLNVWAEKQKYLLNHNIRQPFKQAFRELYPKTDDEREASETNRYRGRQVNVQKAIAVAKGRGWHEGEDIGLQKVFYKEDIVAVLFGIWDYGYSSFNDDPTLSSVFFLNRKTLEIIPIAKINDKMFSEVMRDVDLVVSTSHPQGYDFEESLSTVEVRRQICRNIAELLNLTNVTIEGNFVKISGTLGEYVINLRSAIASKQLSGALNIMAINDSTQNKLFINFIDDNPLTVEVVSKMLLLSDDKKIKDPNIIRELSRGQ